MLDDDDEDDIFAAFGVGDLDEGPVAAKQALATPASPSTSDVAPQAQPESSIMLCFDLLTYTRAEADRVFNHSDPR